MSSVERGSFSPFKRFRWGRRRQLARASTILASALALSVAASGAVAARQLARDDFGDVQLISPQAESSNSGAIRTQLKLRTKAGYDILVNG